MKTAGHSTIAYVKVLAPAVLLLCAAAKAEQKPGVFEKSGGSAAQKAGAARAAIIRAYERDSASAQNRLAYAHIVVNGGAARRLYQLVANDKSSDDSLRMDAFVNLGRLAYAQGRYEDAEAVLEQALRVAPCPECGDRLGLALVQAGKRGRAQQILAPLTTGPDTAAAARALVHLGNVYTIDKRYSEASRCYRQAAALGDRRVGLAALAGACTCAARMGEEEQCNALRERIGPRAFLLEGASLDSLTCESGVADAPPRDTAAAAKDFSTADAKAAPAAAGSGHYFVQVGSFGAPANALALQSKLQKNFEKVTVSKARISERTVYRVRVGEFANENEAEAFGRTRLHSRGISFKVVSE